jgi:hypothetical protein
MDSLKILREEVKRIDSWLTVKTIGDYDLFGNKLFAVYNNKGRLTPFYSVKEWSLQKFMVNAELRALILKINV